MIHLHLADNAWCQSLSDSFLNIGGLELQVKIVTTDRASQNGYTDNGLPDDEGRSQIQQQDQFSLTAGGTYKFKKVEFTFPPGYEIPYPRGVAWDEPTKDLRISGTGGGNFTGWWLVEKCKSEPNEPTVCRDFMDESFDTWNYSTVNPLYDENMVTSLEITQLSENAPGRYKFRLRLLNHDTYVKSSGTGTSINPGFDGTETTTYATETSGVAFSIGSWEDWTAQNGADIEGDLRFEGGRFTGSGSFVHNYDNTINYSTSVATATGTVEIYYNIKTIMTTDPVEPRTEGELGCPDGKCKGNGGASAPGAGYGAPTWNVNMTNLNIFVTDTPLWYRSPIGPPVEVTLSYNSQSATAMFEPVGRKWQLNYESYLSSDLVTGDVTIFMPDGRRDVYTKNPAGGFNAPYRVFNELKMIRQGDFEGHDYELLFPDGTAYVYKVPTGSWRWAMLTEIRDPHANKLTLQWEGQFPFGGLLKQITDAMGRTTFFNHGPNKLIGSVRDPFGRMAYFEYDAKGNLTKITDMGGYVTTFTYVDSIVPDEAGTIRSMVQGSNTWEFISDASGLTVRDNLGSEKFMLDTQGAASYQGAGAAAGSSYGYTQAPVQDGSNHKDVTGLQSPEGVSFGFTYDEKGNLLTDTLNAAGGETAVFTYNVKGKVTSVRDARQGLTLLTYEANGVDLKELTTEGLGFITATYNDTHDITSLTDRLGKTKTFVYNGFGQLVQTTDALGIQTDYFYNDSHQLIRNERAGMVVNWYGYDNIGRISSFTDLNGYTILKTYNDIDDLLSVTYPDGRRTEFTYSPTVPHQMDSMTDQANRTTYFAYNAHRQLREIIDPDGGRTQFDYYPSGNMKKIIDPKLNSTSFEYNGDNRLARKIFADGLRDRFDYTNGRLNRFTSARGITTDYTYDKNGNIMTVRYSDGTPGITTSYDAYNRPVRVEDGLGVHVTTYDAASRPTTIDGPWDNDTLTFAYDARGRKTSVALEKGEIITYSYDDLDRLTEVTRDGLTYTYTYQSGASLLEKLTRPDGSRTDYTYDTVMKRLQRLTNRNRTSSVLNEYAFAFDVLGQVTNETVTNGPALQFAGAGADDYTYNNLNQAVTLGGSATAFHYDADGNMTRGLTGDGRPFDAAYDAENRPKSIQYTDGTGVIRRQEYIYGSDGFLGIQKHYANGVLTGEKRFIRSAGKVLQERNSANTVERDYLWGIAGAGGVGALLALTQGGKNYNYFSNSRGDITAVLDNAGTIAAVYAYDPFGMPITATGTLDQPMRFSTKAYDGGTGLYYYGYRFYSPAMGRWISRDPIGERGGHNLYAFADNNPVNRIDPFGLEVADSNRMLREATEALHQKYAAEDAKKRTWVDDAKDKVGGAFKWIGDKLKENPNAKEIVVDNAVDKALESNRVTKLGKDIYEGVSDVDKLATAYYDKDPASGLTMLKVGVKRTCDAIPVIGWSMTYVFTKGIETVETAPGGVPAMRNPGLGKANQPNEPVQP